MAEPNTPPETDPLAPLDTELVAHLDRHAEECENEARHYRARLEHDDRYPDRYEITRAEYAEDDARIDRAMALGLRERDAACALLVDAYELARNEPGNAEALSIISMLLFQVRARFAALRGDGR